MIINSNQLSHINHIQPSYLIIHHSSFTVTCHSSSRLGGFRGRTSLAESPGTTSVPLDAGHVAGDDRSLMQPWQLSQRQFLGKWCAKSPSLVQRGEFSRFGQCETWEIITLTICKQISPNLALLAVIPRMTGCKERLKGSKEFQID